MLIEKEIFEAATQLGLETLKLSRAAQKRQEILGKLLHLEKQKEFLMSKIEEPKKESHLD